MSNIYTLVLVCQEGAEPVAERPPSNMLSWCSCSVKVDMFPITIFGEVARSYKTMSGIARDDFENGVGPSS